MTQVVLNTLLYQKMFAEQEHFKTELMKLPPREILKQAHEYVCREDSKRPINPRLDKENGRNPNRVPAIGGFGYSVSSFCLLAAGP